MAEQLLFDLPIRTARGRNDFIVSTCNALAVDLIDQWPNWPDTAVCLVGPAASGKSHLVEIWREASGAKTLKGEGITEANIKTLLNEKAVAIDDAETLADEAALFHLYNALKAQGGYLLLAAQNPPARWALELPDLKSRLSTAHLVEVEPADDALLGGLFAKLFQDRQMTVGKDVIAYMVARIERSFEAVNELVEMLDRQALSQQRKISIPLARQVMDRVLDE